MSDSLPPHGLQTTRNSPDRNTVHGILQTRIPEWVPIPFSGDFPYLGIKPGSPALQADSLPPEPPGKPHLGHAYLQYNFKMPSNNIVKRWGARES